MKILFVAFAIFSSVYSLEDDKLQIDKKHFNAFLEEIYGTEFQLGEFVELMWPQIQQLIPDTMPTPAVEIFDPDTNAYLCGTSTTVKARIGDITFKRVMLKTKEKITFEVEGQLFLDDMPVNFGVAMKLPNNQASPTVPMSVQFDDPFKFRLIFETPNVFGQEKSFDPKCILRIQSFVIIEASEPELLSEMPDETSQKVSSHFFENFNDEDAKDVGTVAVVKALSERLNGNSNTWVCSSKAFDRMIEAYNKEWEYTDNYKKICLKKESFYDKLQHKLF